MPTVIEASRLDSIAIEPKSDPVGATVESYRADAASRLSRPMPADRLFAWLFTLLIAGASLLLRLIDLGWPARQVFDEAYYPPEAAQLLHYGFEENRAYYFIVHPPFGKWNIAIGELLFGDNSFGWRFSGVIAGCGAIILISFVVRQMTRSTFFGLIAAVLLAADGFSFTISRTGILDIFLQFWTLLGFTCVILDRDRFRAQLARAYLHGGYLDSVRGRLYGPRVGFRWWRLAAGIVFGLDASVKWSGAYFLVVFAIASVVWDWGAYRAIGAQRPFVATVRRSLPTALWDLLAIPVLVYLATWIGWFMGESAQGRHWAEGRSTDYPWIPEAIRSMWHMQGAWLQFHTTLDTPHPFESGPWSWLFSGRPVLLENDTITGPNGEKMMRTINMIGTPPLWWVFVLAGLWMCWWAYSRLDWRAMSILLAIVAGWASWLTDTERTMFMFYMAPVLPFFIMAVTFCLGDVMGKQTDSERRRLWGRSAVAVYVALVVVMFGFFLPVLNGTEISQFQWNLRIWLTTWS